MKHILSLTLAAMVLLSALVLPGCKDKGEDTEATTTAITTTTDAGITTTEVPTTETPPAVTPGHEDVITWFADLTHTAVTPSSNRIEVNAGNLFEIANPSSIMIYGRDGDVVYEGFLSEMRSGAKSYHLYKDGEGREYILRWELTVWMGVEYVKYEIFSFDPNGNTVISVSGEHIYQFPPDPAEWYDQEYPTDGFVNTVAELNGYLENSFILVSTMGEKTIYGTPDSLMKETCTIP